jgi:phage terminase small subunit
MAKTPKFQAYFKLTDRGQEIFEDLKRLVELRMELQPGDEYELTVLAQAFDTLERNAKYCDLNGDIHEMVTKTGVYPMVRPEHSVMEKARAHILKHSGKFGLNPQDREKMKTPAPRKEADFYE